MRQSKKHTEESNRKPNRNGLASQPAGRLVLLAVVTLLVGLGPGWSTVRVARGASMVTVQAFSVTGGTPTPSDNDYTRIKNAIVGAASGDTINLSGNFNWTEPNAAASWALGNDGMAGTLDDFSILPPANLSNITLTASSLGAATIQGPGDLAAFDLEGVLFFDSSSGSKNQGWTISNLRFVDFDTGILMFVEGGGATDAYSNTTITNNYFLVARDLTGPASGGIDISQNIGIHYAFGMNQTISGNTIELHGDGVSEPGATTTDQASAEVGMQCETSGLGVYDGLQITNNIVRVLNAQSANPEFIRGIWENSHDHSANITVSGNQFLNAAAGNNPSLNLQHGFRVTAHSSATSTVTYQGNLVQGANIGFEWLAGQDFSGHQPVQLISNAIIDNGTGVIIQSAGSATLHFNRIVGNTVGLANATSNAIDATNNWWGCNNGPGLGGAGCSGTANGVTNTGGGSVNSMPWLVLTITAVPGTINVGGTSTLTADLTLNSMNVDTSGSGNVPDGTPVTFAGVLGTVAPPSTVTASGKATSIFTGTTVGVGSGSTTVDMQTVSTPITINAALPTFDVCLQDDSNPNTVLQFNSTTGAYRFCCSGTTYTGTGKVTKQGNIVKLEDNTGGRRVTGLIDKGAFRGSASLQSPPGTTRCSIADRDTRNDTCNCN